MRVILQLSDPHFGTEQPAVAAALLALAREQGVGLAIWSGDITQRARAGQFAAARAFAARLAVPALVVPGNHDIPLFNAAARAFAPYAGFRRAFGHELEPVHEAADLLVVGLNTTRPWRHKDGELSAAQIRRTAARLQAATPAQLRIVVVHQPLGVLTPSDEKNLLHGHAAAARAWCEAGVDLVLGGHIHLPYLCPLQAPGAAAAEAWVVQAGTALSHRIRGGIPNSVNLIRYDAMARPRHCRVERWDFCVASGRFREVLETRIALRR